MNTPRNANPSANHNANHNANSNFGGDPHQKNDNEPRLSTDILLANSQELNSQLNAAKSNMSEKRLRNFNAFARQGVPSKKNEFWKYSDLRKAVEQHFNKKQSQEKLSQTSSAQQDKNDEQTIFNVAEETKLSPNTQPILNLFCIDGIFECPNSTTLEPQLSQCLTITSLDDDHQTQNKNQKINPNQTQWLNPEDDNTFTSNILQKDSLSLLNASLFQQGILIEVAPSAKVKILINHTIQQNKDKNLLLPRLKIRLGEGSDVEINEILNSSAPQKKQPLQQEPARCFYNYSLQIESLENSTARHFSFQNLAVSNFFVQNLDVHLSSMASYDRFVVHEGSKFSRDQSNIRFNGTGADFTLNGYALLSSNQHHDLTFISDHRAAECKSRENYNIVSHQKSHGIYQGKTVVHKDAQKTDSEMMTRGLLLNQGSQFSGKPELEIYADDVICNHGATIASLDAEDKFYCQSRGLDEQTSKALLINAFLGEIVEKAPEQYHEMLKKIISHYARKTIS